VELDDVTSYNIFDNEIYKISSSSLHTLTQTAKLKNKMTDAKGALMDAANFD
jgi:hypothetical protein